MIRVDVNTYKIAIAMTKPIDCIGLSSHTYNALRRWGINTVGELCEAYAKGVLPKVRSIGNKTIAEIDHMLIDYFKKNDIEMEVFYDGDN